MPLTPSAAYPRAHSRPVPWPVVRFRRVRRGWRSYKLPAPVTRAMPLRWRDIIVDRCQGLSTFDIRGPEREAGGRAGGLQGLRWTLYVRARPGLTRPRLNSGAVKTRTPDCRTWGYYVHFTQLFHYLFAWVSPLNLPDLICSWPARAMASFLVAPSSVPKVRSTAELSPPRSHSPAPW